MTDSIVAQLKFQNLSNQSVMAVKIKLRAYDVAGNEIPGVDDYQYLDLNVRTGECWGADKAIILPEAGTRSFSVEQIGILFSGKSTWEITDFTDSISLPKGVPLERELNMLSCTMCMEVMHMIIDLSVRLRQLRLDKRLRQDQVARLVGVSKGAISAYETDIRQPSYDVLIRLANLYRVSTDYLLGRTDDRTLDISGLSTHEAAMISELVASMTAKNQKLEDITL